MAGQRVIDFKAHTLHVLSYSAPIRARMRLSELRAHLFTLPDQPDRIPYRTSYYNENWGFCLSHAALEALPEAEYDVVVDSTLAPGVLNYGELFLPGQTEDEILISTHICHPSLANDNLSGIAVASALAQRIAAMPARRFGVRIVFVPGTIGAIAWLARNESNVHRIKHGLVITGLGDAGPLVYKQTRRADAPIDRVAAHVLRHWPTPSRVIGFDPYGYDERQYNSPGFSLGVGRLTRTPHGTFKEYHTSGDHLDFVDPNQLTDALNAIEAMLDVVQTDTFYLSQNPKGEPRLGKRGLYRTVAGQADRQRQEMALLWALAYADGQDSLLDIAERASVPFREIAEAAQALEVVGLLVDTRAKV